MDRSGTGIYHWTRIPAFPLKFSREKMQQWAWLRKTSGKPRLKDILRNTWPVFCQSNPRKENLRKCHSLKETTETWWLNVVSWMRSWNRKGHEYFDFAVLAYEGVCSTWIQKCFCLHHFWELKTDMTSTMITRLLDLLISVSGYHRITISIYSLSQIKTEESRGLKPFSLVSFLTGVVSQLWQKQMLYLLSFLHHLYCLTVATSNHCRRQCDSYCICFVTSWGKKSRVNPSSDYKIKVIQNYVLIQCPGNILNATSVDSQSITSPLELTTD